MKKSIAFILIIALVFTLSSCTKKSQDSIYFDIPGTAEIQKLLDNMSQAVLHKDLSGYAQIVSSDCPQRDIRIKKLKDMISDNIIYKNYSQKVVAANRIGDAIACTVKIDASISSKKGSSAYSDTVEYLFKQENGQWRLSDFNYHPFINPSVVVGSNSTLYDAAKNLSDSLLSTLYTDINHLQSYGDIIMVGSPYDNASILDLEERGLTDVIVTEEYPGDEKGIVQVIAGVDTYRYVILIQGSTSDSAIESVRFMESYLKEKSFLNAGVYIICNNSLEPADPLDVSALTTLDYDKSKNRIIEVQKNIEANILNLQEELDDEKFQLLLQQKNIVNPFEDYENINYTPYIDAFAGYDDATFMIPMYFADEDVCRTAFGLPPGGSAGAIYAFTDYINESMESIDTERSTSLLRLTGFSEKQAFNSVIENGRLNFFNIDSGYLVNPSSVESCSAKKKYSIDKAKRLENDCLYIDYDNFKSNADKDDIILYAGILNTLYDSKKDINQNRIEHATFEEADKIKYNELIYNTDYGFDLLRENTIFDDAAPAYSSLSEARSQLIDVMGRLLSVKCLQFLYAGASEFPQSQYDYARFAAGFINVEYPNAYAKAAYKGKNIQKTAQDIMARNITDESRIEGILSILRAIDEDTKYPDRFIFPDNCIAKKIGSAKDKALASYGIYTNIFGEAAEAYIALGSKSAYLAFKAEDGWSYIDCKDNVLIDEINDEIAIAFNSNYIYNSTLQIGEPPEFLER